MEASGGTYAHHLRCRSEHGKSAGRGRRSRFGQGQAPHECMVGTTARPTDSNCPRGPHPLPYLRNSTTRQIVRRKQIIRRASYSLGHTRTTRGTNAYGNPVPVPCNTSSVASPGKDNEDTGSRRAESVQIESASSSGLVPGYCTGY